MDGDKKKSFEKKSTCSEKALNAGLLKPKDLPVLKEVNGPKGPEPTRYGDWEQKGRCSDF